MIDRNCLRSHRRTYLLLLLLVINFAPRNAYCRLEDAIQSIAACALVNSNRYETAMILDAKSQLYQANNLFRPRIQGALNYGNQISEGVSFQSNTASLDASLPLLNASLSADSKTGLKNISLAEARFLQKTSQLTSLAFQDIFNLLQKTKELEILENELTSYQKLATSSKATSKIGLSDKADSLMAMVALQRTKSKIKVTTLDQERIQLSFKEKYGYSLPKILLDDLKEDVIYQESPNSPDISVFEAEAAVVSSELRKEQSFFLPQIDLATGVFSQVGVLPFHGYRIGINVDFSGLFRSSKMQSSLKAKKISYELQKEKSRQLLKIDRKIDSITYDTINQQLTLLEEAIELAERAIIISREKISLGKMHYSELSQVQENSRSLKMEHLSLLLQKTQILVKRATEAYFSKQDFLIKNITCAID